MDIHYFNGEWTADITAYISYDIKVKLTDIDQFEDASFDAIRNYTLYYDNEQSAWLIYDVVDREAIGSEADEWKFSGYDAGRPSGFKS